MVSTGKRIYFNFLGIQLYVKGIGRRSIHNGCLESRWIFSIRNGGGGLKVEESLTYTWGVWKVGEVLTCTIMVWNKYEYLPCTVVPGIGFGRHKNPYPILCGLEFGAISIIRKKLNTHVEDVRGLGSTNDVTWG